jgi:hypothetical protein
MEASHFSSVLNRLKDFAMFGSIFAGISLKSLKSLSLMKQILDSKTGAFVLGLHSPSMSSGNISEEGTKRTVPTSYPASFESFGRL